MYQINPDELFHKIKITYIFLAPNPERTFPFTTSRSKFFTKASAIVDPLVLWKFVFYYDTTGFNGDSRQETNCQNNCWWEHLLQLKEFNYLNHGSEIEAYIVVQENACSDQDSSWLGWPKPVGCFQETRKFSRASFCKFCTLYIWSAA